MIKTTPLQTALIAALLGVAWSVARRKKSRPTTMPLRQRLLRPNRQHRPR